MKVSQEKAHLRKEMLKKLSNQKEEERKKKSRVIKSRLLNSVLFKKAKVVMFYVTFDGEVDTSEMIKEAGKAGKIVAVPVCDNKRNTLRPVLMGLNERLKNGLYCVKEPARPREIPEELIDLVVVPGLAFDERGMRLGRGMGFYDRFLKGLPPKACKIGLAFSFQLHKSIPHLKSLDVPVDRVIFA